GGDGGLHGAKPAARGGHERGDDIVTEARTQRGTEGTHAIGKAELDRLAAGPVLAGEQGFFWTLEPRSSTALHQFDKSLMDVALQRLQTLDVLRILREERVEHGFVLTGSIKPAFDSELVHELGKAERAADDTDRADDRGWVTEDLVGGASDHIAPGGSDVLGERNDRARALGRELADAAVNQVGLHRRTAGRVDQQRDRPRGAHVEGALERASAGSQREARVQPRAES